MMTESAPPTRAQLWTTVVLSALNSFTFGYQLGAPDAIAPSLRACTPASSTSNCFHIDTASSEWGLAVGGMCLGALVGCFLFGPLSNRCGRKPAMQLVNIPYLAGLALSAYSPNLAWFAAGRLLIGVGVGGSCVVVPLYLTEIAPIHLRGVIGSFHQMAIVMGYLVVQLMALAVNAAKKWWTLVYALNSIICVLQLILFSAICSETPVYLRKMTGGVDANNTPDHSSLSFSDVIRSPFARRSLTTACLLHLIQQTSGINGVFCYAGELFAGLWWAPLSLAGLNVAMTIISLWLIDRAGRVSLLLSSVIVCILSLLVATVAGALAFPKLSSISVLSYVAGFAVGLGPVPWLMTGEIFPSESAAVGSSVAVAVNWIFNFVVTSVFPLMASRLQAFKFVPFIFALLLFLVYAIKNVPETKGRPANYL